MTSKQPATDQSPQQLAVAYNVSTSEIKDDIAALTACWRSGHGQLPKAQAGFLLWYHALSAGCHEELAGAGLIPSCLVNLSSSTPQTEQGIAAGILRALAANPEQHEAIAKARSGGSDSAAKQLLGALQQGVASVRTGAAAVLAAITKSPEARAFMTRPGEAQQLPWVQLGSLLVEWRDTGGATGGVAAVATFLSNILQQREDLALSALAGGLPEALLTAAAHNKGESTVGALAAALATLARADGSGAVLRHLVRLPGAIRVLVDLLGPPPAAVAAREAERCSRQDAAAGSASQGGTAAAGADSPAPAKRAASSHTRARSVKGSDRPATGSVAAMLAGESTARPGSGAAPLGAAALRNSTMPPGAAAMAVAGAEGGVKQMLKSRSMKSAQSIPAAQAAAAPSPPVELFPSAAAVKGTAPASTAVLLSQNSTQLKWVSPVGLTVRAAAADCLYCLVQLPEGCAKASARLAASRLAALLRLVSGEGADGGATSSEGGSSPKKKKGKKAAALTPEQEQLLTAVSGCLKFLTAADAADSYRVAALGGLKVLAPLATDAKRTLLRRNVQAILAAVAHIREAEEFVQAAAVPEELIPTTKMKLTAAQADILQVEFGADAAASAALGALKLSSSPAKLRP